MIPREARGESPFDRLDGERFDLLVVGGGVYGAWTAYDAALRGLRTALVERDDWGAGTSCASSKLVHGGLRYLERLQLRLVRGSLAERRRLLALGPHRVHPLRFVIPVHRGARIGRWRWRLGLTLYDLLAGGSGAPGRHRALSAGEIGASYPFVERQGLSGGFSYGDCGTDDARLVLEIVDGARRAGAAVANRAEAVRLTTENGRVTGAEVRDRETGAAVPVRAARTALCAGPWSQALLPGAAPRRGAVRRTKGVHLVLPALPSDRAFLFLAPRDGRVFFLIPWYGRTLVGTTDTAFDRRVPHRLPVTDDEVDYLLQAANRGLAGRPWRRRDVIGAFAGVRTLRRLPAAAPSQVSREWVLTRPAPGLLLPVGGKLTGARADAARVVDAVLRSLGRVPANSPTIDRPLPWAPEGRFAAWLDEAVAGGTAAGLDPETARTAALRFGSGIDRIHRRVTARPELAARLHPELPFCEAEIVHAVEDEMARSLVDVLRRRVPLLLLARPEADWIARAAKLAAECSGWDAERAAREIADATASGFAGGVR